MLAMKLIFHKKDKVTFFSLKMKENIWKNKSKNSKFVSKFFFS